MITFVICAALLVAAVLARLFMPLLRAAPKKSAAKSVAKSAATTDTLQTLQETRLAIFRDQLTELEREYTEGLLAASDFAQAKRELERRLLEEVKTDTASDVPAAVGASGVSPATSAGRRTAFALFLIVPLAAAIGYVLLGNPDALDPQRRQAAAPISAQQIEAMVAQLAAKLKQNPEDAKGWVMLARSYKVLERFAESAEAYSHANALIEKDPMLLADYAEVLSRTSDGKLDGKLQGKPSELLARALALDPDEPQALLLAGAAANERGDFSAAADHWSRLLLQLEPGSEAATSVEAAIAKARERAALTGKTGRQKPAAASAANMKTNASIGGEVRLSEKLAAQAKPDDVLFVFARAENGQRMPLAALRTTAGVLPLRFRFDDSMTLPGGRKLSEFKTVRIEARIAKAGKAQTSSGDLFGSVGGVALGNQDIRLMIDQVQP